MILKPKFSMADADRAYKEWGANCGPGAIAAICGLSLDELRPFMADFESKHYTNPRLMWTVLKNLNMEFRVEQQPIRFPEWGLARVQWEGPWTAPGVPIRVRYRHTHWVGSAQGVHGWGIFDINCINNGSGWVRLEDWEKLVVPFLLESSEPQASGKWHLTHGVSIPQGLRATARNAAERILGESNQ